jgi:hypothetical protein
MIRLKAAFSIVILLFVFSFLVSACGESGSERLSLSEKYPGPWVDRTHTGIIKALIKTHTTGCGEFYFRKSSFSEHEYLVACTRDGETWKHYLVWDGTQEVYGPVSLEGEIPDPKL